MHHYNEEELKEMLPRFFTESVKITETHFFPKNPDETGFTEDTIVFNAQISSEDTGLVELLHKEVTIFRIDWDELIMVCEIATKDYDKLLPHCKDVEDRNINNIRAIKWGNKKIGLELNFKK